MAPLETRLEAAKAAARHPRIKVTAIETVLKTRRTADTLHALWRRYPQNRFVWLMGADNLKQIDRWADWKTIFTGTPIAVFARPAYSLRALAGKAARRYARCRIPQRKARGLAMMTPPCWVFFTSRLIPISATEIRERRSLAGEQSMISTIYDLNP